MPGPYFLLTTTLSPPHIFTDTNETKAHSHATLRCTHTLDSFETVCVFLKVESENSQTFSLDPYSLRALRARMMKQVRTFGNSRGIMSRRRKKSILFKKKAQKMAL
jgi:hypothetical protein